MNLASVKFTTSDGQGQKNTVTWNPGDKPVGYNSLLRNGEMSIGQEGPETIVELRPNHGFYHRKAQVDYAGLGHASYLYQGGRIPRKPKEYVSSHAGPLLAMNDKIGSRRIIPLWRMHGRVFPGADGRSGRVHFSPYAGMTYDQRDPGGYILFNGVRGTDYPSELGGGQWYQCPFAPWMAGIFRLDLKNQVWQPFIRYDPTAVKLLSVDGGRKQLPVADTYFMPRGPEDFVTLRPEEPFYYMPCCLRGIYSWTCSLTLRHLK